ncbi:MAG TPA: prepilin-type N-terminal cleavage/methylation domain-containing protein [Candidatus Angelobacter sp.]|nr:prepilin-type N-terminal cleavage/methylation domain-containing protein [Candidatus Angelobacter sp.]
MSKTNKLRRQTGFSLLELLLVVLLLTIVVGAIFSQIERAQVRYRVEDQKLDLTQQEREFIDQFTRDLHQAGFPSVIVLGNQYDTTRKYTAAGVWYISDTELHMEGDVDGDGVIKSVVYTYFDGSGWAGPGPNPCPCIRRSSVAKQDNTAPSAQPVGTAFTQVEKVVPIAGQPLFTAYNASGGLVPINPAVTDAATLKKIKSVGIALTTQGVTKDNDAQKTLQVTMAGMARLVNN